jgi:hypothetical protein
VCQPRRHPAKTTSDETNPKTNPGEGVIGCVEDTFDMDHSIRPRTGTGVWHRRLVFPRLRVNFFGEQCGGAQIGVAGFTRNTTDANPLTEKQSERNILNSSR